MSQENLEIVRQGFHAFNGRNFDAMLADYAEDVEYRLIGGFGDLMEPELRGRAAVRAFLTDWVENVGGQGKMETVLEVDDRVVVIIHFGGCWQHKRCASHDAMGAGLFLPRRADQRGGQLLRRERGPQSRGAVGVGDVSGEAMTTCQSSHATNEIAHPEGR